MAALRVQNRRRSSLASMALVFGVGALLAAGLWFGLKAYAEHADGVVPGSMFYGWRRSIEHSRVTRTPPADRTGLYFALADKRYAEAAALLDVTPPPLLAQAAGDDAVAVPTAGSPAVRLALEGGTFMTLGLRETEAMTDPAARATLLADAQVALRHQRSVLREIAQSARGSDVSAVLTQLEDLQDRQTAAIGTVLRNGQSGDLKSLPSSVPADGDKPDYWEAFDLLTPMALPVGASSSESSTTTRP